MKIVTAVVNNPIFIEIQYYTLQKYFQGDYEFIVFNDAKSFPDFTNFRDITMKNQIEELCKLLNITCINIPNDHHKNNPCAVSRCADSMNFILQYQKQHPDKYLLLDSDMFLIDTFDSNKYNHYDCAIVLQTRKKQEIKYFWNGIYYFDFNKIKNIDLLNWNHCIYCDVGGSMQEWLKNQDPETIYYINHLSSCNWEEKEIPENLKSNDKLIHFLKEDVRNKEKKFFCEIYDNVFLHYRAGGNWMKQGIKLHEYLSNKLKDSLLNSTL
jgi:hypothetical protein